MLIEFRLSNHRSIGEEQALSMEVGRGGDPGDPRPRTVPGHPRALLPAAAIYGANASGKSNVIAGLAFMRSAVVESMRRWEPEGLIPRDPFAWPPLRNEPSTFEVELLLEGVRYAYGFAMDDRAVVEEWIYAWPRGKKQTWLERDRDKFKFGEHLRGEPAAIERLTRPNALFLSAAGQTLHEQLRPLYRWMVQTRTTQSHGRVGNPFSLLAVERAIAEALDQSNSSNETPSLFGTDSVQASQLDRILGLVRSADLGIEEFRADPSDAEATPGRPRRRISIRHRAASPDAWLPLESESNGTISLLRLAPTLLAALETGALIVVDELESNLHPLVARRIVELFNDPVTNPLSAQLVFTTHDTQLLGTQAGDAPLRRDQVWLTEKDDSGQTRLYSLADYQPRKDENLERGYLQGRYGAIPFLGPWLAESEGKRDAAP
jgi:hypothetical protein